MDLKEPLDLGEDTDWARHVVDLKSVCDVVPGHAELAGKFTTYLLRAYVDFEASGFAGVAERWSRYDWLLDRDITIDTVDTQFSGVGAGVADDGALLVNTPASGIRRVTSGTIVSAGSRVESR